MNSLTSDSAVSKATSNSATIVSTMARTGRWPSMSS